jgi:hypothetical protein
MHLFVLPCMQVVCQKGCKAPWEKGLTHENIMLVQKFLEGCLIRGKHKHFMELQLTSYCRLVNALRLGFHRCLLSSCFPR